jgi:S1-C subfamily serine protease
MCLLLSLLSFGPCAVAADQPSRQELSKLGKSATAFVEVKTPGLIGSGTAFCIHPSGLFVTNDHVINLPRGGGNISLVLHAGEKDQRLLQATVVRQSKEPDLALLRVTGSEKLPSLALGTVDDLAELAELVAFGFPFGNQLALTKGEYPSISVNSGSVTALRRRNGELQIVQVDVTLNPGNSGGPVLDRNGKVVGVVVAGVRGSGVNFVIPVNLVARFLAKPELHFTPPALTAGTIHQPVLFQARADQLVPSQEPLSVDLILRAGAEPERKHKMALVNGVYQVSVSPIPKPDSPPKLRVAARYSASSITGNVADRTFTLDSKPYKLSDVRRLQGQPKVQVTFRDGRTLEGTLADLEDVPMSLGKQEVQISLARAVEVSIEPPAAIAAISCTIVVTQGTKEIARQAQTLAISPR